MLAFFRRMIRDKYKAFIAYAASAVALLEMYVALYPSLQQQAAQIDQMMKSFPPELFSAMNMDASALSFSTLESYLSTEYMSFLWPILAIIFAISIAHYISVNEIDRGTIETLASLPTSRIRIFVERYFAGLLIITAFAVISLLGIIPLAGMHGIDYVLANYLTAAGGSFLFIWAVYSLAVLVSVIFSEKGKASMVTGGILTLMYVLSIISSLKDGLKNLQYLSFFHYFSGTDLLAKNAIPDYMVLALGGFAVVASVVALMIFRKRDLSV